MNKVTQAERDELLLYAMRRVEFGKDNTPLVDAMMQKFGVSQQRAKAAVARAMREANRIRVSLRG